VICDQGFEHPDPEPVVVEEAVDTEPLADSAVEIARLETARDVAVAKIENRAADEEVIARIAALEAENEALRSQLAPPPEEQQQEAVEAVVVVAPEPEPEPVAESEPPVGEPSTSDEPKGKKRSSPWW